MIFYTKNIFYSDMNSQKMLDQSSIEDDYADDFYAEREKYPHDRFPNVEFPGVCRNLCHNWLFIKNQVRISTESISKCIYF